MKIKKGDTVKMITGKDLGKTGKVIKSFPSENKVSVEGLNIVKKHSKPRRQGEKGQIIEIPRKVNVSNVIFVCPKCGKGTRLGYRIVKDEKYRMCKKCGAEV